MAKTSNKIKDPRDTALVQWAETKLQNGTPTVALLPARNFCFRVLKDKHKIIIPRKGSYHNMDPDFFSEQDGEFNLLDEKSSILYMPAISKVLFAARKYPDLKSNQLFTPIALIFKVDTVEIMGQVIEMLNPEEVSKYTSEDPDIKSTVKE